MKTMLSPGRASLLLGAASVAGLFLAGCAYDNAGYSSGYRERRVEYVQDDYVYYPQYEVYYSNRRHQYYYRNGNAWVWQPAPPHVSASVLISTPSVRLDFHDAPERHHTEVVRTYPRNWRGSDKDHDGKNDRREDRRDDRRDDRKDDRKDDHKDKDRQR